MPIANPTVKPPVFSIRDPVPSSSSSSSLATSSSSAGRAKAEDNFNGALHCAKAFGVATLLVGTGATVSVYGLKTYMGVKTVCFPYFHASLHPLSALSQLRYD